MSNLGFEPGWISFTTKNLTSWAKPTQKENCNLTLYLAVCNMRYSASTM
jgi:hypothetical protein